MTTEIPKATCATCPSWARGKGEYAELQREHGWTINSGECRRTSPAVSRDRECIVWTQWPETDAEQWCGDHPER